MKLIKRISIIIMLFMVSAYTFAKEVINIAVMYSKEGSTEEYKSTIEKEFTDVLGSEYVVEFPEDKQLIVGMEKEGIEEKYDELVNDKDVTFIVGGDHLVSNLIAQKQKVDKLTIMPFVQYIANKETSEVKNLTYSIQRVKVDKVFKLLRSVDEDFTEVSIISPISLQLTDDKLKTGLEKKLLDYDGTKVKWIEFDGDYEKLAADVKGQKIALLGGFNDPDTFSKIIEILDNEKIVTYADGFSEEITSKAYLSFDMDADAQRRIRKSAVSALEILEGAKAEDQEVYVASGELRPVINRSVADKIGKWPNWRTSVSAKVIGDDKVGEELTFYTSITEGLNNNLQLLSDKSQLDIQGYQVDLAKSSRLPQVVASGGYKVVDNTQADIQNDVKRENLYVGVGLRQVIWNDEMNSAVSVQKNYYTAEEAKYKQKELDTVYNVSVAYFNVLRLKAYESIQYSNLELTKKNLELARVREKVGYSRKSDVYRWESKLATDISKLSNAQGSLLNAKEKLMNVLNANLNTNFRVKDISDTEEFLGIANLELTKKHILDEVVQKLTEVGVKNSYKIKEIDGYLAAEERKLKEATRSFYSPEVALTADYKYYMDRMGSGNLYDQAHDGDPTKEAWTVGVEVTIPLLEGGGRVAERNAAKAHVQKLTVQREDTENKVKQQIRAALTDLVSAQVSVESSIDARVAADKTLKLVTDSYSRGEVSITELLDSQNVAIQAKESESSAKYNYYTKLMKMERAVGSYHLLNPEVYSEVLDEINLKVQ